MPLLISIILKGLILGFVVSIPLGPVAILCVRRTLQKGQSAGLLSGAGAMFSDLIYAAIAYTGIGFVISFIERYETAFQLLGSLIFFLFGAYMYLRPPNLDVKDAVTKPSWYNYFLTSFACTIINPGILLLYLAGFSRFDFTEKWFSSQLTFLITMLAIGIGAMLWWTILTGFVSHIRQRISITDIKSANKVFAIGVMIVSCISVAFIIYQFFF